MTVTAARPMRESVEDVRYTHKTVAQQRIAAGSQVNIPVSGTESVEGPWIEGANVLQGVASNDFRQALLAERRKGWEMCREAVADLFDSQPMTTGAERIRSLPFPEEP